MDYWRCEGEAVGEDLPQGLSHQGGWGRRGPGGGGLRLPGQLPHAVLWSPCRCAHHCFPQGVGVQVTDLQRPADPTCALRPHRAARGDGVPGAERLQAEAAGPSGPFCLHQRLVRRGLQVRAHIQVPPQEGPPASPSVFPMSIAFEMYGNLKKKSSNKQTKSEILQGHYGDALAIYSDVVLEAGTSWKGATEVTCWPQPSPCSSRAIVVYKGLHKYYPSH